MSTNSFTSILLFPLLAAAIVDDFSKPTAEEVAALQADDAALNELVRPGYIDDAALSMMGAPEQNIALAKAEPAYLRGLLKSWSNIVRDEDDELTPELAERLQRARMGCILVFQMGPGAHWIAAEKRSQLVFFNVGTERKAVRKTDIDVFDYVVTATFGDDLVADIARHVREHAMQVPAEYNGKKVVGDLPTDIADAIQASDEDLVRAIGLRLGGNFMRSTRVRAPAQPMPHRLGKGKDAENLGDFVPESRKPYTNADGTVVNGDGFPLAIGIRFDAFRYPSLEEVKVLAVKLGKLPATPDAAAKTDEVQTPDEE